MNLHRQHPLRQALADEVHARPPVALDTPEFVSYLAFLHEADGGDEEAHLAELAAQLGLPPPDTSHGHALLDAGEVRLKWERHGEFSSYTFIRRIEDGQVLREHSALLSLPAVWRQAIPGQLIVATHVELRPITDISPASLLEQADPHGKTLVASRIANGAGWVFTDFQLEDGFTRFLLLDAGLTPRQTGRTVQRLLEIETYRVMAMMAFPVAREVGRLLNRAEGELADLMDRMGHTSNPEDEREVLGRLTRLAAEVERSVARTTFRFGAARAYEGLVRQRIEELREVREAGFPTISEFMTRRLTPAMATCTTMAQRQEDLSSRIARNSQMLRTRVDIELERQNQAILAQMNRRAKIQLRLQETVEGLSVVAITYYASQLVQYIAKGAKTWLPPAWSPEGITALSIPVIAGFVALGLARMRRALAADEGGH